MAAQKGKTKNGDVGSFLEKEELSPLQRDLILIGTLAVSVLLFISNIGLGGAVGGAFSKFFFGMIGAMNFALPFLIFFGVSFYIANRKNALIGRKILGLILIGLFLCVLFQLISYGYRPGVPARQLFSGSAKEHNGGGLIGGLLLKLFGFAFGTVGAIVITVIGLVVGAVILTQRPLLSEFRSRSGRAVRAAKEKRAVRRERADENGRYVDFTPLQGEKEEKAAKRPERKKDARPAAAASAGSGNAPEPEYNDTIAPSFLKKIREIKAEKDAEAARAEEKEREAERRAAQASRADAADEKRGGSAESVRPQKAPKTPKDQLQAGMDSVKDEISQNESAKEGMQDAVYELPPVDLLTKGTVSRVDSEEHLMSTAQKLQETFQDFGVNIRVTDVSRGPTVTRYELQPEHGVKVSKILSLSDDIKLSLATSDIRIEAPIPGKAAIGIEVPNKENSSVMLRDLIEAPEFRNFKKPLAFAVGKDIGGKPVVTDISKMPHLLIAGATGSGKSVCINTLIVSILYKSKPDEVRFLMIDPKVVELKMYNGIPHLLIPVVTDPKKASGALNWAVAEMTERYAKFAEYNGVRDIDSYNERVGKINEDPAVTEKIRKMPRIVVIVDELADLMMVAPGEVEDAICRLAQLARAAGIHLILATQRPSVNVVTGLIKANMPSRIALAVSSGIDSRTILDMNGAEKLLGRGDMLFYPQGYSKPARVQGAYVSDEEIAGVVKYLSSQNENVVYNKQDEAKIQEKIIESINHSPGAAGGGEGERDEYFTDAGYLIIDKDKASIGMLQRVFKIGFNRAARIMDQLHEAGVVSEEDGTKPRNILMSREQFEDMLDQGL